MAAVKQDDASFVVRQPRAVPASAIRQLHSYQLLTLYNTAAQLPADQTFYPSVFPKVAEHRPDPTNIMHAGCFCFDSGTPLNHMTLEAASWSAACAREAAASLRREKHRMTYALSRPPGHHATRQHFGGYSYFNNAAIAARYLRRHGRVALLDVDFHHGNGTQDIFYRNSKVLTVSIHGDPREFYPYFAGYADENGAGAGEGFNLNFPLPGQCDGPHYLELLEQHVLPALQHFGPDYLVVSAGHDTYKDDPIGHFALDDDDFIAVGERIGRLGYPTVVIQEGGYNSDKLGGLVRNFLCGMRAGLNMPRIQSVI